VDFVNWYLPSSFSPPVPALLQGESPYFFPYNHLGPYRQETYPVIPTLAQGGEASIVFEVDLRGYVQGIVMGIDWNDAVRTVSWATVQLETDSARYFWYSWDGWFEGYLDAGSYRLTLMEWTDRNEGHATYRFEGTVSAGQMGRSQIIVLDLSGIPIPELSPSFLTVAVGLSVACGAFVARKIRRGES